MFPDDEAVQRVAGAIGDAACAVQGDITLEADRQRIVAAALDHGAGLHGLVNNAGNMYRGPLETLTQSGLMEVFNTNVVAA